ncbi:hypothetical protein AB6A40_005061 [Gnathostoma spinigerum]|uniref:Succinate--CoA ligase [GDP-forming] subunit beta, mitochondrial n=1 Tax=Gnathostoma spinigerum TaxID=75299 RepID=A0ABD6EP78_9BILA
MLRARNARSILRVLSSQSKTFQQFRWLNLHEYQSKSLLEKHGCSIQQFIVASSPSDACESLRQFDRSEYVVKSQILAGGRGKGHFIGGDPSFSGIFISTDKNLVLDAVKKMLGQTLVTKQTGKKGVVVEKVMIAESVKIVRETYLAFLMDRDFSGPVAVASPAGGMDIETIAKSKPELIFKEPIDIEQGISTEQSLKIARNLEFKGDLLDKAAVEIRHLYDLFIAIDATQVEINPLAETLDGRVICVDAKLNFDDSAAFRQEEIFAMGTSSAEDVRELEAQKYGLNYIGMDGDIACLVNGAGLAMATMDLIKLRGGEPANFLDVGGGVTEEQIAKAFQLLISDPKVKSVLINIFGGIVNCLTVATGIINAFKESRINLPVIVRLEGTNVKEARKLLEDSGLPIISAFNFEDAAQRAVDASKHN